MIPLFLILVVFGIFFGLTALEDAISAANAFLDSLGIWKWVIFVILIYILYTFSEHILGLKRFLPGGQ